MLNLNYIIGCLSEDPWNNPNWSGNFWAALACDLCSGELTNKTDMDQVDITFQKKGRLDFYRYFFSPDSWEE
jgi:hypothetical protein